MVDEEVRHRARGRAAGLKAAREAFYVGDIAQMILQFHRDEGGLLSAEDLSSFAIAMEDPIRIRHGDYEVYGCGPWCQGGVLLQALRILEGFDLESLGHNSPRYIHTVAEALKLAFADRHHYYGDPRFVDVPMRELLSEEYAQARRALVRADRAWPEMPPPGDPRKGLGTLRSAARYDSATFQTSGGPADTSYVCVVDSQGNVFSATPSDDSHDMPVVPGTGLCPSSRGSQSWTDERHPACVAPGKRPRITPNPALVFKNGRPYMPIGTPGGDVQPQAMLQVLLNIGIFRMDPQAAVEAPRFASYSFPDSFEPHPYYPGRLNLEARMEGRTGDALTALGHSVEWWPKRDWRAGGVCLIVIDPASGVLQGAADSRRPCYALGW
jgi:gamma-glutamyltranspeptidase/glutathione hydrolase